MTPVWILFGCVAVIGVVMVLYKRGVTKSVKAAASTPAAAKQ
jgi:hypothetical protein